MKITEKHQDFFRNVYDVVRLIPEGRVTSYGAIGRYLGSARSARMVGWAMHGAHSQVEPVPAHRVVNRAGVLTGKHHFSTPFAMQEALEAEGITVIDDKIKNLKAYYWDPNEELSLDD